MSYIPIWLKPKLFTLSLKTILTLPFYLPNSWDPGPWEKWHDPTSWAIVYLCLGMTASLYFCLSFAHPIKTKPESTSSPDTPIPPSRNSLFYSCALDSAFHGALQKAWLEPEWVWVCLPVSQWTAWGQCAWFGTLSCTVPTTWPGLKKHLLKVIELLLGRNLPLGGHFLFSKCCWEGR